MAYKFPGGIKRQPSTLRKSFRHKQTIFGKRKGTRPKGLKFHVWNGGDE